LVDLLSSILILYSWIVAAILIFFLYLIGGFYEKRFGQKSKHELLILPAALFLVAVVWDVFFANDNTGKPLLDFVGAPGPDLLYLAGGLVLIGLVYSLYRTMMGGRR
jgi:hypothetical protein